MKLLEQKRALAEAVKAAQTVGALMARNLNSRKVINAASQHDLKLELDVRSQKLIERALRQAFPHIAILGEEGVLGDPRSDVRWVVDPIDGTVNFAHGIPHACVSIALQARVADGRQAPYEDGYETLVGVVHDPFTREMWTAIQGQPARLNGRVVQVSQRAVMSEAVLALGFSKTKKILEAMLPSFGKLVHRVRKIRIMGAAALSLVYVGGGRMDVYLERGVRLWDIAAGGLIVECAGGEFWHESIGNDYRYAMVASNGLLGKNLKKLL